MSKFFIIPETKVLKRNNNFGVNNQIDKVDFSYDEYTTFSKPTEPQFTISNSEDFEKTYNERTGEITNFNYLGDVTDEQNDDIAIYEENFENTSNGIKYITNYNILISRYKFEIEAKTFFGGEYDETKKKWLITDPLIVYGKHSGTMYITGNSEIKEIPTEKNFKRLYNKLDFSTSTLPTNFNINYINYYIDEENSNKTKIIGEVYSLIRLILKEYKEDEPSNILTKIINYYQNDISLYFEEAEKNTIEVSAGNSTNNKRTFNMNKTPYFRQDRAKANSTNILNKYENGKKIIELEVVGGNYFGIEENSMPELSDTFSIWQKSTGTQETKYIITNLEINYNGVLKYKITGKEI